MNISEYKKDSYEFSKSASELIRQFAFAGIAIIWIFKNDNIQDHVLPSEVIIPLLLFLIALASDLFQYLIPSIIWSIFYIVKEKKVGKDEDVKAPNYLSAPGWIFFILKNISLISGYYMLMLFLIDKI